MLNIFFGACAKIFSALQKMKIIEKKDKKIKVFFSMAHLKITLTVVKAMDAVAEWVLCISCFANLHIKLIVQCLIECQLKYSSIVVTVSSGSCVQTNRVL